MLKGLKRICAVIGVKQNTWILLIVLESLATQFKQVKPAYVNTGADNLRHPTSNISLCKHRWTLIILPTDVI